MRKISLLTFILLSVPFLSHQSVAAPSVPKPIGRELFHAADFDSYGMHIDRHGKYRPETIRKRSSISKRFLQVRKPQAKDKPAADDDDKNPNDKNPNDKNPTDKNPTDKNPTDKNPTDKNPTDKDHNDKDHKDPTPTSAKGNATPTKSPTPTNSAGAAAAAANGESITSDQAVPTGSLSSGAIAGLSVVGAVFLVSAGLIVFIRKKKRDERTSAIVAKSAMAFEQQTHEYEKLDEPSSLGTFTVISTYAPTMDDEIEIQPGDRVTVFVAYDDGWVQGVNESRDGAKGVFPRYCIDMDGKKTMAHEKRSSSIAEFTPVNLN